MTNLRNLFRDELYKNRSSLKIDCRRLFSREHDFPKTFLLTENQFSPRPAQISPRKMANFALIVFGTAPGLGAAAVLNGISWKAN